MKLTHRNKLRMARRTMTPEEIKAHISPWRSIAWVSRQIKTSDGIGVSEGLTNTKPWFNGMKTFSSVKVNPAPLKDPNVLEVNVYDGIAAASGLV